MRNLIKSLSYFILLVLLTTCEIEKTEFKKTVDEPYFYGFAYGPFIIHSSSISYYSPEKNIVFNDLYFYQNERKIRRGIHSYLSNFSGSLISYEDENVVEWIDPVYFTSEGFLDIDHPRNITFNYSGLLISYGLKSGGGIAIIDYSNRKIIKTINTVTETGKIVGDNEFLFVLCDGEVIEDSLIYRLYNVGYSASQIHKIDSIVIGIRPVDAVSTIIEYPQYYHDGLAILCLGNESIPASIVMFDLVTDKIAATYSFESTDLKPENIFWHYNYYTNSKLLVSYINNKLYTVKLENPVEISVLIDKNVSQLFLSGEYFLTVSRDTTQPYSSLYRFDAKTLSLVDSIRIAPNAKQIVQ